MKYGVHIKTKGNVPGVPSRANEMGAEAIQIFAGSPRTFKQPTYDKNVGLMFQQACAKYDMPAFIHMMYLTAYATPDDRMRRQSIDAAKQTMVNAETLGVQGVVTHMGSHKGLGMDSVLEKLRSALLEVLEPVENSKLLLEISAGAGGNVGNSIDELAQIFEALDRDPRVGFCLDTAHMFAGGIDVRDPKVWRATLEEFDSKIGLDRLGCLHLNDSKVDLATKRDRHENIGAGFIGEEGFRTIINEPLVTHQVGILEVPGLDGDGPDKPNLDKLRALTT